MSNSTLTLLENIREGNTLNLFYEVSIALITKTEKNIIGKKKQLQTNIFHEHRHENLQQSISK